jgi:hypothetical protein
MQVKDAAEAEGLTVLIRKQAGKAEWAVYLRNA